MSCAGVTGLAMSSSMPTNTRPQPPHCAISRLLSGLRNTEYTVVKILRVVVTCVTWTALWAWARAARRICAADPRRISSRRGEHERVELRDRVVDEVLPRGHTPHVSPARRTKGHLGPGSPRAGGGAGGGAATWPTADASE